MVWKGDQGRKPVLRIDYRPPAWLVDEVRLDIRLDPDRTLVDSRMQVRRNPDSTEHRASLALNGAGLGTLEVAVNDKDPGPRRLRVSGETLVIGNVPDRTQIRTRVQIQPARNTALEGLYQTGSCLLTQCEAEGFRKITWFPDRPDVMARYRVRLEADRERFPVLLGNGNREETGELPGGRHYAVWVDPFPKPCYLFALVAGDLACLEDRFITASGREVALKIYSEHENLPRLEHAMASLKKAMAWDEKRFGLEYDLDVYHIVATHDFNMGAMENKSLNIFNTRFLLADPDTATDADYQAIEAVVAHEYFHNWTGNRVTCRDWFQLTLKEGLTVFREQEFSSDMQSRAVKRITDVRDLLERQFPEDDGPMAHAVRPERYIEINNFYTATVYDKGAEVVRMVHTLLGAGGFRRGLDLYFSRHDGRAASCDDFLAAMADANDVDLTRFARWYSVVGTPVLNVTGTWNATKQEFVLEFTQSLPAHPDNHDLEALVIPVAVGFLDPNHRSLPVTLTGESGPGPETRVLVIDRRSMRLHFQGLEEKPLVSLLRGFSAPVKLRYEWSDAELARLLAVDPDPVSRWLAGRRLALRVLADRVNALGDGREPVVPDQLVEAWEAIARDEALDPALAAELLKLPSEIELTQSTEPVDVDAIHLAREQLEHELVERLDAALRARYLTLDTKQPWRFDADAIGRRRLVNTCLALLCAGRANGAGEMVRNRFTAADNMTDRIAAMTALVHTGDPGAGAALADFDGRYRTDPLAMDKWYAVQASRPHMTAVETVRELMGRTDFNLRNPNKVKALIGTLALRNPYAFHRVDGAGYRLLGEVVGELDRLNPQVAARLVTAFSRYRAYPEPRRRLMRAELESLHSKPGLSPDVEEIVSAALKQG